MPQKILAMVRAKTTLEPSYADHAAPESMDVYLTDWEQAAAYLQSRIGLLRGMRDERVNDKKTGRWPPKSRPCVIDGVPCDRFPECRC